MKVERTWINVKDKLPDKPGWYLVFAPAYSGGSSTGLNHHKGVMFSQFNIAKNGNKTWSIEVGYHERPGCVLYWMPLPVPLEFGHFERKPFHWSSEGEIWVENATGEESCLQ